MMMRAHAGWVGRDRGMVEHFTPKKRAEVYKAMVGVVMIGGMQFLLDLLDLIKSLLWKYVSFRDLELMTMLR